jgi:hypothetical protein
VWPVTVSAAVGTAVIIGLNIYTQHIMQPPMGFEGVALSLVGMQWASLFTIVALIIVRKWWLGRSTSPIPGKGALKFNTDACPAAKYSIVGTDEDELELAEKSSKSDLVTVQASVDGCQGISESDPEDNFPDITLNVFCEWVHFLKLGIPGAASLFIGAFLTT